MKFSWDKFFGIEYADVFYFIIILLLTPILTYGLKLIAELESSFKIFVVAILIIFLLFSIFYFYQKMKTLSTSLCVLILIVGALLSVMELIYLGIFLFFTSVGIGIGMDIKGIKKNGKRKR